MLFLVFIYITYGRKQADFSLLRSRVADPVGFYPDPDLTFKKKPDLDPNFVKKLNPDPILKKQHESGSVSNLILT